MYPPREDSFLLASELERYLKKAGKIKVLDMGTGSGILAETASKFVGRENVLAVDIDSGCVGFVEKMGIKAIKSDLFSNISEKFDLIVFNPPYLPEDEHEKGIDTTGGQEGYEITLRFLKDAWKFLNKDGKVLLILSSLSKPEIIKNGAKNYKIKEINSLDFCMERLLVWEMQIA